MGQLLPQICKEQTRVSEDHVVGVQQMCRQPGHTAGLHRHGSEPQRMPRRDDRRGCPARYRDAAKRKDRFPKLAPVKVAGGVLRECPEQIAVAFRLLEQMSGCQTISP